MDADVGLAPKEQELIKIMQQKELRKMELDLEKDAQVATVHVHFVVVEVAAAVELVLDPVKASTEKMKDR